MRFRIDYEDHRTGTEHPVSDVVHCPDLTEAERQSLRSLCHETSDASSPHAAASITIRDEEGKPLSVTSVHATVKRL